MVVVSSVIRSRTVGLKREPLGSLREEFLIPGRKFVPGRNWRGKVVSEKNLSFYYSTLTNRGSGHTPFMQTGAETSDTGAEVVEPDPHCSLQGYSRGLGRGCKY